MLLFKPFKNKPKIGGIIKALRLEEFWLACTEEEQNALTRYYSGLGDSPIKGNITTSQTALNYFSNKIGWAVSDKDYALADKIIFFGEKELLKSNNLIDHHFFLQLAAECYYKQRSTRNDAIEKAVSYCLRDIKLFPQYAKPLRDDTNGIMPRIMTFQRLAIIYEKNEQFEEALHICALAMKYGLDDGTKGGYQSRIERLKKRLDSAVDS